MIINRRVLWKLGRCVLLVLLAGIVQSRGWSQIIYEVRMDATWSASTHPGGSSGGAHFSPLIGAVHNEQVELWAVGELASLGIERMAELGVTSTLRNEVLALGSDASVISGPGLGAPDVATFQFSVTDAHPRVSLVTMVAPSPDWFVGVSGLDLGDGMGGWQPSVVVDLFAYDAGTDSGTGFTSPNNPSNPHVPIGLLGDPTRRHSRIGDFYVHPYLGT